MARNNVFRSAVAAIESLLHPRSRPAHSPAAIAGQNIPIYLETPPHVLYARKRAREARWLFSRYVKANLSVSRRSCMNAGMTAGQWQRGRQLLIRAGVVSAYDGRLLYAKRDCELRLSVYLDTMERMCYASNSYVHP